MSRLGLAMRIVRVVLVSAGVVLAGAATGEARQSDVAGVKAAVEAFHAALGSLDVARMAALWMHDPGVTLINPRDKSIAIGWDAVEKDWRATFNANTELKITQTDGPQIQVHGNTAWQTGLVTAAIKLKGGQAVNAATFETSIFEKRGGRWLLVSHAAWRVPQ